MKLPYEYFTPIVKMPDHLKDGRNVLGFNEDAAPRYQHFVMFWQTDLERWYSALGAHHVTPTHYMEFE